VLHVTVDEAAEEGGDDGDDETMNPLIDALFDEVEELRMRVCCSILENRPNH
jgi:hypothetical protein